MAAGPTWIFAIQAVIVVVLIISLVLYQPALPSWVSKLLYVFIFITFVQVMVSLQGKDKYYFLYSLSLAILFGVLYMYYIR